MESGSQKKEEEQLLKELATKEVTIYLDARDRDGHNGTHIPRITAGDHQIGGYQWRGDTKQQMDSQSGYSGLSVIRSHGNLKIVSYTKSTLLYHAALKLFLLHIGNIE